MNESVAKLWIEALRSGEYRQGKGELRSSDNCFCVMGVLCDLAHKYDPVHFKWKKINANRWEIDGSDFYPSFKVLDWAHIYFNDDDELDDVPLIETLIKYNDEGLDFDGLADVIEEFWDRL